MDKFWSLEIWQNDNIAEIATYMGSHSFSEYAYGFLELAKVGAEKACSNQCSIDSMMPAILYNIRHSVELFLKSIILEANKDSKYDAGSHFLKKIWANHKIDISLYMEYEPRTIPFPHQEWISSFEGIVNFVDAFDSDGQSMRYPTNRKESLTSASRPP